MGALRGDTPPTRAPTRPPGAGILLPVCPYPAGVRSHPTLLGCSHPTERRGRKRLEHHCFSSRLYVQQPYWDAFHMPRTTPVQSMDNAFDNQHFCGVCVCVCVRLCIVPLGHIKNISWIIFENSQLEIIEMKVYFNVEGNIMNKLFHVDFSLMIWEKKNCKI